MAYSNGYLPQSVLAPIAGGGYLRKDAAAAWNAMAAHIYKREGVKIHDNGEDSDYRSYARQEYWRDYWCNQGACGNAAIPGTSNHGWGLAIDVPPFVQALIAKYGRQFGWAKEWSDAPHEEWHFKWNDAVWHGEDPGPDYLAKDPRIKKWKRRIDKALKRISDKVKERKALARAIEKIRKLVKRLREKIKRNS